MYLFEVILFDFREFRKTLTPQEWESLPRDFASLSSAEIFKR